jgi:diaminohydroxyphosphoribosylaminopyrimidine deaminase/5-amino-6-(5-phosphoribosylamino)uracil reductase
LRVVVDSRLRLPVTAKLLAAPGATLVATASADADRAASLTNAGVELALLPGVAGRVDLAALLAHLAQREVNELLVEAGATLSGALLDAGLIDELIVYIAPHVLGAGARGMFDTPLLARMAERAALTITDVRAFGPDWRILAKPCR